MENRPLVLIAAKQPEITRLVTLCLEIEGFKVVAAADAPSTLDRLSDRNPDVLVLDATMPGMSGIDFLREVRASHPVPVILLSAHGSTASVAEGLDQGADDYVVMPFNAAELAARIRAVTRRSRRRMAEGKRSVGAAEVDLDSRTVTMGARPVRLSRSEWLLLEILITNESRVLLHDEILTHVWGPDYRDEVAYLRLWVGQLRRKVGIAPWEEGAIRTIQGLGYAYDPGGLLPRMHSRRPRQPAVVGAAAASD